MLLGVLVLMANNGLIIAGLTAFDARIIGDLHLSVTALKLRDAVTIVALGVSVPVAGYLLDKVPTKAIIVAGLVAMAVGLGGYRFVRHATDIYAIHILLGLSQAFCGLVSHIVLVSRWTRRHRGVALGAIVAGSSIGNGLAPSLNTWLDDVMGWRNAIGMGALVAAALIPLVLTIYQERPSGQSGGAPFKHEKQRVTGSFAKVVTSKNFWLLSFAAAATAFCILSLATSLVLYVERDLKAPLSLATCLLMLLFAGATGAQLMAGLAADWLGAGRVHVVLLGFLIAATTLLGFHSPAILSAAVFLFGASWGGNASLLQIRPVLLFPRAALGRALAGMAVIETLGASIASPMMAFSYEKTGHYHVGYGLLTASAFAALVCIAIIGRGERGSVRA